MKCRHHNKMYEIILINLTRACASSCRIKKPLINSKFLVSIIGKTERKRKTKDIATASTELRRMNWWNILFVLLYGHIWCFWPQIHLLMYFEFFVFCNIFRNKISKI